MKKLHFSIQISAPRKKVWEVMLNDKTYREWTSPFMPGGYYEGSWDKGSKILFVAPNEIGKKEGMVSCIDDNKLYEYISIKHLGIVSDGIEDTTSEHAKRWAPAFENYTFKDSKGGTELLVDMDSDESEADMFDKLWPKALQKLKQIAEK